MLGCYTSTMLRKYRVTLAELYVTPDKGHIWNPATEIVELDDATNGSFGERSRLIEDEALMQHMKRFVIRPERLYSVVPITMEII